MLSLQVKAPSLSLLKEGGQISKSPSWDHDSGRETPSTGMEWNAAALRWYLVPFHLHSKDRGTEWKEKKCCRWNVNERKKTVQKHAKTVYRRKCREITARSFRSNPHAIIPFSRKLLPNQSIACLRDSHANSNKITSSVSIWNAANVTTWRDGLCDITAAFRHLNWQALYLIITTSKIFVNFYQIIFL